MVNKLSRVSMGDPMKQFVGRNIEDPKKTN
jgi:hypothetical protein